MFELFQKRALVLVPVSDVGQAQYFWPQDTGKCLQILAGFFRVSRQLLRPNLPPLTSFRFLLTLTYRVRTYIKPLGVKVKGSWLFLLRNSIY